jgi:hypothetical protein
MHVNVEATTRAFLLALLLLTLLLMLGERRAEGHSLLQNAYVRRQIKS